MENNEKTNEERAVTVLLGIAESGHEPAAVRVDAAAYVLQHERDETAKRAEEAFSKALAASEDLVSRVTALEAEATETKKITDRFKPL